VLVGGEDDRSDVGRKRRALIDDDTLGLKKEAEEPRLPYTSGLKFSVRSRLVTMGQGRLHRRLLKAPDENPAKTGGSTTMLLHPHEYRKGR
uniref:Cytochrome cd1 nitrite reductase n=1 Tax=Steinernema glaseri TaxID=37863 RepID=A0A1I7XXI2_9BILA